MTVATLFDTPLLLLLLPIVAFLYASVGHGGASGYLALMSLFSFPMTFMKPTALVLNILVSAVSFYFYYKERKMNWSLFYPFALTSIPFSFLGGFLTIDAFYYKINKAETAAVCLMVAHRSNNKTGLKIIPPPIPNKPDKKPMIAPMVNANGMDKGLNSVFSLPKTPSNRSTAKTKTVAKIIL
jgi:uncharacterized membrane protein YfcA